MTVLKFRKAGLAPRSSFADMGRGVALGVAPPIFSAPSDSPQQDHAASFLHAGEGGDETFVCSDAMDSAKAICGWALGFIVVESALTAFGLWLFA